MDWKEEMKMGMLMIQSACQKNTEWEKCTSISNVFQTFSCELYMQFARIEEFQKELKNYQPKITDLQAHKMLSSIFLEV